LKLRVHNRRNATSNVSETVGVSGGFFISSVQRSVRRRPGYTRIVLKQKDDSRYSSGRSPLWIKNKNMNAPAFAPSTLDRGNRGKHRQAPLESSGCTGAGQGGGRLLPALG
jgi:hypothetical protein